MSKNGPPKWHIILFGLLLFAITAFLFYFQISTVETATKTEIVLVNILQFICSLGFSVILARIFSEQQFLASQRKFAIGAFRRIKEIERLILRTERYLFNAIKDEQKEKEYLLPVINESLAGAKDIVRSSIADWADIIGDEIEVETELQRLRKLREEREETGKFLIRSGENSGKLEFIQTEIQRLKEQLPAELRAIADEDEVDSTERSLEILAQLWKRNRSLVFSAFWEPTDSFKASADNLKLGDVVYIAKGFTEHRPGPFLIYDEHNNWIAVVTNLCADAGCDYDSFIFAVEEFYDRKLLPIFFGGTPLEGKVIEIEEIDPVTERRYFQVEVQKLPSHECAFDFYDVEVIDD